MKNRFDPRDPALTPIFTVLNERTGLVRLAMATSIAADSVRPSFVAPPPKFRTTHIGSCVLIRIFEELFVFSASHVFEELGQYRPIVACGDRLHVLEGERFSTLQGPSGTHRDDPIDASVFHLQGDIPKLLRDSAFPVESLDLNSEWSLFSPFAAIGYRAKRSKIVNGAHGCTQETFPSMEYPDSVYRELNIDRRFHIALAFEKEVFVDGRWQKSPKPKGMSGGGIFRIHGLSLDPKLPANTGAIRQPLLSAITIEQREEKHGRPGVLLGTRIGVHLGLINRYLPDLFQRLTNHLNANN